MERKNVFLIVGLSILGVGILVGVVFFLRNQNQVQDIPLAQPTTATPVSALQPQADPRNNLTPQEQAARDQILKTMQTMPKDIRDTWTPEYRAQMEQATTTKRIAPAQTP